MPVVLIENFRAVFYAPFYAARSLGAYEAEGLEVELKLARGSATCRIVTRPGVIPPPVLSVSKVLPPCTKRPGGTRLQAHVQRQHAIPRAGSHPAAARFIQNVGGIGSISVA